MKYGVLKDEGLDTQRYESENLPESHITLYTLYDTTDLLSPGTAIALRAERHKWQKVVIGLGSSLQIRESTNLGPNVKLFRREPIITSNLKGVTCTFDYRTNNIQFDRAPDYAGGQPLGHVVIEGTI